MAKTRKLQKLLSVKLLDPNSTKRRYVTLKGRNITEIKAEARRRNLI